MVEEPGRETTRRPVVKSPGAFRTISEVARELDVPQHVLRFWEGKFTQIRPLKRAGGRRYYRPDDVALLRRIRTLLYGDGYTIKGVQKLLRERGVRSVIAEGREAPTAETNPLEGASSGPMDETRRADLEKVLDELVEIRDLLLAAKR